MRHRPDILAVPTTLHTDIEAALAALDRARADLHSTLRRAAPLAERRAARAAVTAAFGDADRLLRRATQTARPGPYSEWRRWRHRLSLLDLAWQSHLFEESDDVACLRLGSERAVDTGMTRPNIGELAHGHSRPPGTPARYGLDMDALLTGPPRGRRAAEAPAPGVEGVEGTRSETSVETGASWPHAA